MFSSLQAPRLFFTFLFILGASNVALAKSYEAVKSELEKTYSISIHFGPVELPSSWDKETAEMIILPVNARKDVLLRLKKEMEKYKVTTIKGLLDKVIIFKELSDNGRGVGGHIGNFVDRIPTLFLKADYIGPAKDIRLGGVFHHEFSSALMDSYGLAEEILTENNPEGFRYFSEYLSKEDILKLPEIYEHPSTDTWEQGFVLGYGKFNFENDVNTYFGVYMSNRQRMEDLASKYPRIKRKLNVIKAYLEVVEEEALKASSEQ